MSSMTTRRASAISDWVDIGVMLHAERMGEIFEEGATKDNAKIIAEVVGWALRLVNLGVRS